MSPTFKTKADAKTVPIVPIEKAVFEAWRKTQAPVMRKWVETSGFTAQAQQISLVSEPDGRLGRVLFGVEAHDGFWSYAGLPGALPAGTYQIDARCDAKQATGIALGWALGRYSFERYRKQAKSPPGHTLVWPDNCDRDHVQRAASATTLVRDLINTPAADMGPAELAAAARGVAGARDGRITVISGEALLKQNYPAIHAVGRASVAAPRLIDLRWGRAGAPKVTLVGKGVCFDSGGLDIKPAAGMLRMKKDMGGAAQILGLADMIMAAKLDVRLRVLIPAVENSIAGNALRPLDVIRTRKGTTVEVGNTDAEGRLVLCDALAEADREGADLIVDCATLTGAARIALGTDLPAMFCNDDVLAADLLRHGENESDPLWRLPLWRPYRELLDSKVADINNVSEGGLGGAITAALYLQEFVHDTTPWIHLDIMAWNVAAKPGRPVGGDAMGMRALYALIESRFGRGHKQSAARRPRAKTKS